MPTDSLTLIAAVLLLAAAFYAALGGGAYLRFAAMLFAALALACLVQPWLPGLGEAAALLVLPLGGTALALCVLARFARKLPALPATLLLIFSLGCGLGALLGLAVIFTLAPLALGGAAVIFASLHRMAVAAAVSGALLVAAACAFTVGGAGAAPLSLLAAALFGLGVQNFSSNRPVESKWAKPVPGLP